MALPSTTSRATYFVFINFFFSLLHSVGLHTKAELDAMVERMKSSQLHTINLTENDLVKDHLRHLVRISKT